MVNPLNHKSDQNQFSPKTISTWIVWKVLGEFKEITLMENSLIFYEINCPQLSTFLRQYVEISLENLYVDISGTWRFTV